MGGGVSASAMERNAPASTLAASLCGFNADNTARHKATPAPILMKEGILVNVGRTGRGGAGGVGLRVVEADGRGRAHSGRSEGTL